MNNPLVSVSPHIRCTTMRRTPLSTVLNGLHSSRLKPIIEHLRSLTDKPQIQSYKAFNIPWVTLAVFDNDVAISANVQEVHGLVLDIDECGAETPDQLRDRIAADKWVTAAFISPGGKGVKVFVLFEFPLYSEAEFKRVWSHVVDYYELNYGVRIDRACSDVRRACYMSYDPDAYINHDALGYPVTSIIEEPEDTDDRRYDRDTGEIDDDEVVSACKHLCGKLPHHEWISVGLALASQRGESGRSAWLELSLSPRFTHDTPERLNRRYDELLRHARGGVTLRSLFAKAYGSGWVSPRRPALPARQTTPAQRTQPPVELHTNRRDVAAPDGAVVPEPVVTPMLPLTSMTEAALAESWIEYVQRDYLYNHTANRWHRWTGLVWEPDDRKSARHSVVQFARILGDAVAPDSDRRETVKKLSASLQRTRSITPLLEMAASLPHVATVAADYDRDPDIITTLDGTVNLRTGELRPASREDMVTRLIDIHYRPGASRPFLQKYLDDVFVFPDNSGPDPELQEYIQRAVGYTLTGSTDDASLFFLFGEGKNGKTVFFLLLERLLRQYMVTVPSTLLTPRSTYNPAHDISSMESMRLVVVNELSTGSRFDEGQVKTITGGDALQSNKKYQQPHTFRPTHKVWTMANDKPSVRGGDEGIWRRIRLIPMYAQIAESQLLTHSQMLEAFESEIDGILAWAIEGAAKWYAEGNPICCSILEASSEYREDQDFIRHFVDDRINESEYGCVRFADVWKSYQSWSLDNNAPRLTPSKLGMELSRHGLKTEVRGQNQKWLSGCTINNQTEVNYEEPYK